MSRTLRQKQRKHENTLRKQYFEAGGKVQPFCSYGRHCCGDSFGVGNKRKKNARRLMRHILDQKFENEIKELLQDVDKECEDGECLYCNHEDIWGEE